MIVEAYCKYVFEVAVYGIFINKERTFLYPLLIESVSISVGRRKP